MDASHHGHFPLVVACGAGICHALCCVGVAGPLLGEQRSPWTGREACPTWIISTAAMDFKEQLKSSVDIVKEIGDMCGCAKPAFRATPVCARSMTKKRRGSRCTCHQFYKCFGCGAAGDVLKFVMEFEHVSFPEALKLLAERTATPCPSARSMPTKISACGPPHFRFRNWPAIFREQLASPGRPGSAPLSGKAWRIAGNGRDVRAGYAERSGRLLRILERRDYRRTTGKLRRGRQTRTWSFDVASGFA